MINTIINILESPGFNINFESAPFKLTMEYVDLMGGADSNMFQLFEQLFLQGFRVLQRHSEELIAIVQLFFHDTNSGSTSSNYGSASTYSPNNIFKLCPAAEYLRARYAIDIRYSNSSS